MAFFSLLYIYVLRNTLYKSIAIRKDGKDVRKRSKGIKRYNDKNRVERKIAIFK